MMKYFTIKELSETNKPYPNVPNEEQIKNLTNLVEKVLDPIREELGSPITVSSGFRSWKVNKAVGGVDSSQHTKGEAVDLVCNNNAKLFELIQKKGLYDQLIWEYGTDRCPAWVHVSLKRIGTNRKQILHIKK
jgi:zinc D-Ala-D-Ala carboxypeptidase